MAALLLPDLAHTVLTIFIILGLIAFRLVWGHPAFRIITGYLPNNWQNWLLDKS